ncbi:MAG: hypothetical protein NUW37_01360 [Planctomycetes bacterium]|nr:hypothetical protein [Planctomycetota bacterium]
MQSAENKNVSKDAPKTGLTRRKLAFRATIAIAASLLAFLYFTESFDRDPKKLLENLEEKAANIPEFENPAPGGAARSSGETLAEDPLAGVDIEAILEEAGIPRIRAVAPPGGIIQIAPEAPGAPEEIKPEKILYCLDYLGTVEYDIYGTIFGQALMFKRVGAAKFLFNRVPGGADNEYDIQFLITMTDPIAARFTFSNVIMRANAFEIDGYFKPKVFYYSLQNPGAPDDVETLRFDHSAGIARSGDKTWKISSDCYCPVTHLVNAMNRTLADYEALANEEGKIPLGHISVRGSEEMLWGEISEDRKHIRMLFSKRAFPGGGTLIFAFREYEGFPGVLQVDNKEVELSYGQVGGVMRYKSFTPAD